MVVEAYMYLCTITMLTCLTSVYITKHCTSLQGRSIGSSSDTSTMESRRHHAKNGWKWGCRSSDQAAANKVVITD